MRALVVFTLAFALPGFSHFATEPDGGQVLRGRFPGTYRDGFVYLPPEFTTTARYPVVYLLHGLPGSPSEYLNGTHLGRFADQQIATGRLRPFIAVIPAAGRTPHYGGEWADQWENNLIYQVLPWVDAHLPTIRSPSGRVIAGLSAGGYGAIDIALRHPRLFGIAESWSGYFAPLHDGPFTHADHQTLSAHNPTALVQLNAAALRHDAIRFFISTGPAHSRQIEPASSSTFARLLRRLRLPVSYHSYPNTLGEWRVQLDTGLRWAFAAPVTGTPAVSPAVTGEPRRGGRFGWWD